MPKSWSRKYNIKPGDEIDLAEQGNALTILPQSDLSLPQATLDVRGLTPVVIWRFVSSAYRAGYNEFKILFDHVQGKERYSAFSYNTLDLLRSNNNGKSLVLSPIEVIQAMVNRCIGIEIIDQKENWCTIKELGETTYKEFDNALRRIFLLLISLVEEISKTIKEGHKTEFLKSIHLYDTNIDRFTDFCFRVLNKKGYKEFRKTPTIYSILFLLEMVGDEFKKISIHLTEAKQITKKMESLFRLQHQQLKRFYQLFYTFHKDKVLELYEENQKCNQYYQELFPSLNNEEKELLHHLKKTSVCFTSLTELRIDLEY